MEESKTEVVNPPSTRVLSILAGVSAFVVESIESIISALAICIVLYLFVITPQEVIGESMLPTFENGEYLIANKIDYRFSPPERGDVIIFKRSEQQDYIKRIVGLPGEEVSLVNGRILVNGEPVTESSYLGPNTITNGNNALKEGSKYIIPEDEYFVLGDNRSNSTDSRYFGSISFDTIKGKVWFVYFPFSNFRIIDQPEYQL